MISDLLLVVSAYTLVILPAQSVRYGWIQILLNVFAIS